MPSMIILFGSTVNVSKIVEIFVEIVFIPKLEYGTY